MKTWRDLLQHPRVRQLGMAHGLLLAALLGLGLGIFLAAPPAEPPAATPTAAPVAAASGHDHAHGGAPSAAEAQPETVWTCSMHPQVRLPEAGQCPLCGMDLIPVTSGGGGAPRVALSEAARALAAIETVPVERRAVDLDLRLVGKVAYDETRVARITAWLGGRIERLFVDYTGTHVAKGDHLFELYSPELLVAQQDLLQASRQATRLGGSASEGLREGARETVRAASERLRLWGLQKWQVDRVLKLERPMKTVTIYAPIGGIVTQKAQLQGSYVETGTPVYTIADLGHVWVVLEAFESDVQWIHYGQDVRFEVVAYPGREFHGTVTFVSPTVDPATRTVKVRLNVPNPELALKPDMFVRASLQARFGQPYGAHADNLAGAWICPMHPEEVADDAGRCGICGMKLVRAEDHWLVGAQLSRRGPVAAPPLVVPATAPLRTGRRAVVFVEEPGAPEPTYLLREVVLGPRAGDWFVVVSGLEEGERVVSEGAFKLDSALQIRGDRSLMALDPEDVPEAANEAPLAAVARTLQAVIDASDGGARPVPGGALRDLARVVEAAELDAHALRGPIRWLRQAADDTERRAALALMVDVAGGLSGMPPVAGADPEPESVTEAFREALRDVLSAARDVAKALADDAPAAAREAAAPLPGKVAALQAAAGRPLDPWLGRGAEALVAPEANLAALRAAFLDLNTALVPLALVHGDALGGGLQVTFCPMASDNSGAFWVQAPGEVANPYFGASMLRCGEAVRTLGAEASP